MADRTTLKDVAREAGVHVSTASRALNPSTSDIVNAETLVRVQEAAHRLGYRPHPLARGLRTNRTMSVGMIIPDVENPLFGALVAGAEPAFVEDGYSVIIGSAQGGPEQVQSVVADMVERRVDGLILATASRHGAQVEPALARGVPAVLVNRTVDDDSLPAILGDDHAGVGLAVRHLASLGHERIGHVAGPSWVSTGQGRRNAFLYWMHEMALGVDEQMVEEADWYQVEPGYVAARKLMSRRPSTTAIVAANDLLALGCYRAIRTLGREVGSDVSVTGYNDIPLLDLMQPALTSVRVPYRQMGARAAACLLQLIAGEDSVGTVRLAPQLMIRQSTATPRVERSR